MLKVLCIAASESLSPVLLEAKQIYGERGIRTLGTDLNPYTRLAGEHLRPLGHLSTFLEILHRSISKNVPRRSFGVVGQYS